MVGWGLQPCARAFVCIARDAGVRLRDIATTLGVTECSALGIVTGLTAAGYVVNDKEAAVRGQGSLISGPIHAAGKATGAAPLRLIIPPGNQPPKPS